MRLTRLYHPHALASGETVQLDSNASSHLIRVLRSRPGTRLVLFNGDGCDYHARTLDADPRKTSVVIESHTVNETESGLESTLIQGLSRQDRMDTTIQKSVELGINRIIPLLCERSSVRLDSDKQARKQQHWQKVAISACAQSGRSRIPQILPVSRLSQLPALLQPQSLRLMLLPEAQATLSAQGTRPACVEFIIGPEGGLDEEEIVQLSGMAFQGIRFGPRVLRTETAGPAILSALQLLWGDC